MDEFLQPPPPPFSKKSRTSTHDSVSNSTLTLSTKKGAGVWVKKTPRKKQSYLDTDHPDPQAQHRLDVSIVDFSNLLLFSLTQ